MTALKQGYRLTHPGEVIKDEIEYRGISQRQLAEETGIPYKALNDLLNGRRTLTTTTAMIIEAALDIPAESLMHIQLKYSLHEASNDKSLRKRLAAIRNIAAVL